MNETIKNLYSLFDKAWDINNSNKGTDLSRMVTTYVPDAIQDLQFFVDKSEEKYYWEKHENIKNGFFKEVYHICTYCKQKSPVVPFSNGELVLKYCPNCGEKMEKLEKIYEEIN